MSAATKTRRRRAAPSQARRLLDEAWRATESGVGPGHVPLSVMAGQGASFYDGSTPTRRTVTCPDCREPADALFGDHAGGCIDFVSVAVPGSALHVIRRMALEHGDLSSEQIAVAFRAEGVRPHSAASALESARRRGWIVASITGGLQSLIVGQRLEERAR